MIADGPDFLPVLPDQFKKIRMFGRTSEFFSDDFK
jgi:hypothetical protein